jgi:hypothetical protein
LRKLPRSAALSHLYRAAEAAAPPNFPPLFKFGPSALWEWIKSYLKYVFHRKHPFPAHTACPRNAMYGLTGDDGGAVRVSLAADWGTGTEEAASVAAQMSSFKPHYTIHLGDVYYVGDPPEVRENCLNIPNPDNNYEPLEWPHGSLGSFAMNGNHEMYAKGDGYFDVFLPTLGINVGPGKVSGQHTSFFCLENRYWRIIALDTGYNSTGIFGNCRLPDAHIAWLKEVVRPAADTRGIVLLSHHEYYSGFECPYTRPARQLWDVGLQRPALWFWGHEHRLAGYELGGPKRLQVFGRCIGHGGMPIDPANPKHEPKPLFYDLRHAPNTFGVNGFVNLTFTGSSLASVYVDLDGTELLRETWTVDANGAVRLSSIEKKTSDPGFIFRAAAAATA